MNVHMTGLPSGLTDRSLQSQLGPFMTKLSITGYSCFIYKKRTNGRVTFLHKSDGEKFLNSHGLINRQAKLYLMQQPVVCTINRGPPPTEFALKRIEYEVEKSRAQPRRSEQSDITFELREVSCGHFAFLDEERFAFVSEWAHSGQCIAKFTKHNLILEIPKLDVKARVPYQTVEEMVWSEEGRVAISLSAPPTFLKREHDTLAGLMAQLSLQDRARQTEGRYMRVPFFNKAHGKVSSFCLVYFLSVPTTVVGRRGQDDFLSNIDRVKRKDLFWVTHFNIDYERAGTHIFPKPFEEAFAELKELLQLYTQKSTLPFGISLLLEALVRNSYLHPNTVKGLAERLAASYRRPVSGETQAPINISVQAVKKLFMWINYPSPHADTDKRQFQVDGIMEYLEATERKLKGDDSVSLLLERTPQNLIEVFRAVITPTRTTLHGPDPEASNRVLRMFPNYSDYFIRVSFCDESGEDLFFNPQISLDPIYERFKGVLAQGISVAGRVYKFLGFSHSSLRSHSVWLSAPFVYNGEPQWADFIIRGLGDFEEIKSPARRAARIGQAFSETPYSISLAENGIQCNMIPDIERFDSDGNKRCFSDGVGTISLAAAEIIWSVLPESKGSPTCFQVRWAGAKGMLSLDTRLPGRQICIRGSMEKFKSRATGVLEICDTSSRPIPMVLNRQLIKLLEDMEAPEQWFLDLQEQELKRLRGITATVFNTATFLQSKSIGDAVTLPKFLRKARNLGADYREEPFLRNSIEAIILRELKSLKHGARIPVPKGVTLFGIMDETGFLKDGEVYVTFDVSKRHLQRGVPEAGRIVVTRSPALHPGDIQIATYVVPPAENPLRELQNCVVFSQHGDRDLPSKLSGGDLDGDLYNIIWDPEIVDSVNTFKPASYPRIKPRTLDVPIEPKHMAEFFVDFMKADRVGVIANRHLMVADQQSKGTLHADCITLAELHSNAVDFSKTGWPVEMKKLPQCDKSRPDFLAPGAWVKVHEKSGIELDEYYAGDGRGDEDGSGPRYQFYKSEKVLGKLYRAIDERKIWAEDVKRVGGSCGQRFWETLLDKLDDGSADWKSRQDEAERLRHTYEEAVFGLMVAMADHPTQPLAEFEVFVGIILNKTGKQSSRQRDRSIKLKRNLNVLQRWSCGKCGAQLHPALTGIDERLRCVLLEFMLDVGGHRSRGTHHRAQGTRISKASKSWRLQR